MLTMIMKLLVCVFVSLSLTIAENRHSYEGYKVYQVTPRSERDTILLKQFEQTPDFDFWSHPHALNESVSIMVSPAAQANFERRLDNSKVDFSVLIHNVEKKIQEETLSQLTSPKVARGTVSFTKFMRHAEINDYLQTVASTYPEIASLVTLGKSYEGRDLLALKISSGGSNKPTIFVDAGIHAREWIAPPVALYIIQQLVENSQNAALYKNVDWVILPSLNPDGYEYTQTTSRLWRKTRSPGTQCDGTDANRNFDFHWMEVGASSSQCSETYAGRRAFSELETQALRDYLVAHGDQIKLYLTFHSYGQYILYPWGYTSALPSDNAELKNLGDSVNQAIRAVAGTRYTVGTSTNVLYAAAGGSDDYAKGVAGIELSYTIELPGGGANGFDPPASKILPVVQETWEGVKVYQKYIEDKFVA